MSLAPVLIAGGWRQSVNPVGTFSAVDPATRAALPDRYPISGPDDIERAMDAGREAVAALRERPAERLARFLEAYADRLEARQDALVELAARETGLPSDPRLRSVELPRTTNQLRQGAAAARDRSWCHATIDTKANVRSHYAPLDGPVVVLGPSNFPFAFNSVAGGDFVAAVAAGNPVICKANPGHPGTTRLLAEEAQAAANAAGLPAAMVQLLYHMPPEVGLGLVAHRSVGATAFTGSKSAGLRLKASADAAGKPIYLEMSSVNPVFVLPGALDERLSAIAKELYDSCSLGAGQFCTRPGLAVVQAAERAETFIAEVAALFERATPGTLLGAGGVEAIAAVVAQLGANGASVVTGGQAEAGPRCAFANTLLRVTGEAFLARPDALQAEAFGPVNLVVVARDAAQTLEVAAALHGSLTACIYSAHDGADDAAYARLAPVLRERVGRLLNDKMPTGVAVSSAMNHGGPYPATGHPGFTAVGVPASILRFAALHCYDTVRADRLPPEIRDVNPTGRMWRLIDGEWSQRNI